ncbi:hypothetical protein [Mesorhizobium sp. B1-1-8]|uniref:hypothetical protein n=1 Tax=Mesorhizobium sp. B1-1-8 TaxID=2589976 RepID=UPI001D00678E|nr:hypothetical protein [Mesorhizobium sp. B1-1-8]UCI10502.1 hypothetical protein FJ974_29825 [Mesorhizobium sp. B1-1-8]
MAECNRLAASLKWRQAPKKWLASSEERAIEGTWSFNLPVRRPLNLPALTCSYQNCDMIRGMSRKAERKAKEAIIALPFDDEVQTEAAYYARKCGITTEEALRIINEASPPKPAAKSKDQISN